MVSVKNEINEVLLNCISDLENRLEESRTLLSDIQDKMDSKVNEAKEYKVQVDDAKDNIKRLENEIKSLENDLVELKEKYSKKNLFALIDAGTKEINEEVYKKQEEIQIHKNKITDLTNRARSIKDLLMNLKRDKRIKEDRLNDLEICVKYYKNRLENVVKFAEEHDNLDDYFVSHVDDEFREESGNIFETIVNEEDNEKDLNIENNKVEDVTLEEADEVFNDVINSRQEESTGTETNSESDDSVNFSVEPENKIDNDRIEKTQELKETIDNNKKIDVVDEEDLEDDKLVFDDSVNFSIESENKIDNDRIEEIQELKGTIDNNKKIDVVDEEGLEDDKLDFDDSVDIKKENLEVDTELKITDLLNSIKAPISLEKEDDKVEIQSDLEKVDSINKSIDQEYLNIFGQNINEPIKTVDFFGNEYKEENNEDEIVNKLTNIGIDYYSFTENDREIIKNNFNEQTISDIVNVLKTNKIQLDNIYVDGKFLSSIAPRELENIISKLIRAGQSADAIGYILDKLPLVDSMLLDATINNYGDYVKNIDIVDIIFKSLKEEE